jgi:serine-type D-Ala-D-Ala carboxypeptidase/endopeptidase
MKLRLICTFVLVSIVTLSIGQTPRITDEVKSNIQARIANGMNAGIVVAVIDGGQEEYYSAGKKSLVTSEAVNENSVFEIGSISKTFTGILLANAVLNGEVKLDDPVQKYLPATVVVPTRNGEAITLQHLANHTSSLPRMPDNFRPSNPANPFADYSEQQIYDFLTHYTLMRDIGSQYEYSNFGMGLLGHILALKKGITYEQLMIDVIAKQLALPNTRIALTAEMKKNLAAGHVGNLPVENWDIISLAGAGGIRSSAVDMVKYVRANMGVTKSKLYPAMQLAHKNSRAEGTTPGVGFGWHLMNKDGQEIIWHNGGTGGYRTFIGFVKGTSKGVVVLSNSANSVDDIGTHLLVSSAPLNTIDKPIELDPAVLDKYVGKYALTPAFALTVTRSGTQLKVQATGQSEFPVFAKSAAVFYYTAVPAQLTFNIASDATRAESVTLEQNGQKLTGQRVAE